MALILAIDPERKQGEALTRLGRELAGHELLSVASCADALVAVDGRIPDLVLLSPFVAEAEERTLLSDLRARSSGGEVPALTIPMLRSADLAPTAPSASGWFGRFRRPTKRDGADGCEPRVFADLVREYLASARAASVGKASRPFSPPPAPPSLTLPDLAPPGLAPPNLAPPGLAPPGLAPPDVAPASLAPPPGRVEMLAAANAAAIWVRARRASWGVASPGTRQAPVAPTEDVSITAEHATPLERAEVVAPVAKQAVGKRPRAFDAAPSVPRVRIGGSGLPAAAKAAAGRRSFRAPVVRWLPRVVVVTVLLAAGVTGRAYWLKATTPKNGIVVLESVPAGSQVLVDGTDIGTTPITTTLPGGPHTVQFQLRAATRTVQIVVPAGGRIVEGVFWDRKTTGRLQVSSDPAGARVVVDGAPRGSTPLLLEDLTVGSHTLVLETSRGSVQRSVVVKADETVEVAETVFAGWLAVFSPFDLVITEGIRAIRLDDRNQVLLPAGPHELRLENLALGYQEVRRVDVQPGQLTSFSVVPPPSLLTVTATAPAAVWLDGVSVGQTPLIDLPVDLGTRQVVLKSAAGAERRLTVIVTVKPVGINVDFSKPLS